MSFSVVTKNAEDFGLSLPQSASLTAPSSEGAFGRKTIIYMGNIGYNGIVTPGGNNSLQPGAA